MFQLTNIIGFLGIKPRTVRSETIAIQGVDADNIRNRAVPFYKADDQFAVDLLNTTKRMVYPILGGAAQTVPAGNRFNATALLGATSPCLAEPTFDSDLRVWTDLGAIAYNPENMVSIRIPGASPTASEPFRDDHGREVFGRLNYEPATGAWYVEFKRLIDGTEQPYSLTGDKSLLLVVRQWVPGSSSLLEDPGQVIVSAPGAVDITETNNIDQLAGELGVTLSNTGVPSRPFGKSLFQKWIDHLLGMAGERHNTSQVDASPIVVDSVPGLTSTSNLDAALVAIQGEIDTLSDASETGFRQIIKEFRSNGILGVSSPIRSFDANAVRVDSVIAYVDGQRFAVEGLTNVQIPSESFRVFYVDEAGVLQASYYYPDTPHAKIGIATANSAGTISIKEEFTPLRVLDQRVDSVEELLTAHIGTTTAHPAGSITFDPPSGINSSNLQEALEQYMELIRNLMMQLPKEVRGVMMDGVTEPTVISDELNYPIVAYTGVMIEAAIRQGSDSVFCGHIYVVNNEDGSRVDLMVQGLDMGNIGVSVTAVAEDGLIKLKYTSEDMPGPAFFIFKPSFL